MMDEDLRQWFKQKWVDISRKKKGGGHPACGASANKGARAKDSSKKYPKCVPANKAKNMSKKQKKSAVTRKRRAPNEPGSPDNVRTDAKKESIKHVLREMIQQLVLEVLEEERKNSEAWI